MKSFVYFFSSETNHTYLTLYLTFYILLVILLTTSHSFFELLTSSNFTKWIAFGQALKSPLKKLFHVGVKITLVSFLRFGIPWKKSCRQCFVCIFQTGSQMNFKKCECKLRASWHEMVIADKKSTFVIILKELTFN